MSQTKKTNEQLLANEQWYHGLLPREEMKVLLTQKGDFLVRFTDPKVGEPRKFVLSIFVGAAGADILHYVLKEQEGKFAVDAKWFQSIPDLLNYYHRSKEPVANGCHESVLGRPIGREPWEKQHSDVTLLKKLGEGAFGEVQLGEIKIGNTVKKAAIKLAKLESLTKEQIKEIMHEARLMRKFKHPNVVTFYGVAAGQEPLMVIMELCDNGALDSYLKKNMGCLLIRNKNMMVLQAARGLEYLHSLQVIHRDIASRNCLYGNGQVKISDFGLSREGSNYRLNPNKKVPIRWLAPEVPRTGFYTSKTDVFAFGIMCWEVYHDGSEPYPGMKVAEVLPRVQEGYRMGFGPHVPEKVVAYITDRICAGNDSERVTMSDVIRELPTIEGFEAEPHSNSYFEVPGTKKSLPGQSTPDAQPTPPPILQILPYMTQPVTAPAGAVQQATTVPQVVEEGQKRSTSNNSTDELSMNPLKDGKKRGGKPVPVKQLGTSPASRSGSISTSTSGVLRVVTPNALKKKKNKLQKSAERGRKSADDQSAEVPSGMVRVQKKNNKKKSNTQEI